MNSASICKKKQSEACLDLTDTVFEDELIKHFIAYDSALKNQKIDITWFFEHLHVASFDKSSLKSVLDCIIGSILRSNSSPSRIAVSQTILGKQVIVNFKLFIPPFDDIKDYFRAEDFKLINTVYAKLHWKISMQCNFKEIVIEWNLGELYRIDDTKTPFQRQLGNQAIKQVTQNKSHSWPQNCKILIAESNNELREYLTVLFSFKSITHSIQDNLELYEEAIAFRPDIIITDVNMLNDFSSIKACRESSQTSHIPIFMLSNTENEKVTLRGLEAGCADVICKPFSADELLCKIANALVLARSLIQKTIQNQVNRHLYIDSKALNNSFTKKLDTIIEEHFKSPDFCSAALADYMNVSVRQLQRVMLKNGLGQPSRYINVVRTHKAYKQLCEGSTIQQAVYENGFSSTHQFARHFKKLYNMNPSDIAPIIFNAVT